MKVSSLFLPCLVFLGACNNTSTPPPNTSGDGPAASAATTSASTDVMVTDKDDGKTFPVTIGQNVVVELPSNPTTGFQWVVLNVDKTLGQPTTEYVRAQEGTVGAGGKTRLTWRTQSPLGLAGTHAVLLGYQQEKSEPARVFKFTLEIK